MPTYYNLTGYENASNIIVVYAVTDEIMKGAFSLFLVAVFGIWITYMRIQRNDNTIDAIIFSSFFSLMLAISLYISNIMYSGMTSPGLYVFVPAIILISCSIFKIYNKY